MRKIIETTSTLVLWAVFIVGSSLAVFDFFFNAEASEQMQSHLSLIAWAPIIAMTFFVGMLIAVYFSRDEKTKKTLPSEHTIQWSPEELAQAQSGKVVDLYFAGTGLACQVLTREEAANILHIDNQQVQHKVSMSAGEDASWTISKVMARSVIIGIMLSPRALVSADTPKNLLREDPRKHPVMQVKGQ